MDLIDRYEEAAAGFTDRLAAVTDDQWSNPTPCTDWDVCQLVDHVITIQRQIPDSLDVPVDDEGGGDRRATWRAVRAAAVTALRQPGVMERTITGIRGEMPVEMALLPRLSDLTVHTWDLARATGGDERLSAEIAAIVLERLKPNDEALRQSGSFGPKIDPPADADAQVELLCFLGRRP
jgi:uncharacterized protein (TIGR03086 family)